MKVSTIIAEAQAEQVFLEYLQLTEAVRQTTVKLNRYLNTLTEAQARQLNPGQLHDIFLGVERAMTAGGQNKNLLGKGADLLGKVGAGIGKVGQAAADSAIGKGFDKVYRDAKQKISTAMGKTETGSMLLRKIDHYQQLAKKYPHLNDAVTKATSILAGAATGGATGVTIGAAVKAADTAVKGGELTDVAGGAIKGGALAAAGAAAVKAPGAIGNLVDQGVDAYNNLDLNPFDNDVPQVDPSVVDPNAPPVSDVYPDEADRGVKPDPDNVNPPPKPVPPKPVPPKPVPVKPAPAPAPAPTPAPTPDVTTGSEVPDVNSTAYLDAAKQNIISQNMAAQNAGVPNSDILAQNTVTQPVAPRNIAEAFRALDFKVVALPLSIMVDKESTVRRWALNESLGRPRGRGVQLTDDGVNTVFYNVDKFYRKLEEARRNNYGRELRNQVGQAAARTGITGQQFAQDNPAAFKAMQTGTANPPRQGYSSSNLTPDQMDANQEGGTVRNRPANANDPVAMAKNAPSANTSSTAGPTGSLPGGPAPAGNTMPYLAADPEGKFKTTYSGDVGNKVLDKAEQGLRTAKNYMGDLFKAASTKFDANQAKARFKSSGAAPDSQSVADFLAGQKVPADIITQVYKELGMPKPTVQAAGAAKDQGVNRHSFTRGIGGGVDTSNLQEPDQVASADDLEAIMTNAAKNAKGAKGAKGQKAGAAATGTDASAIAQQSGAAPQQQKVAREIDAEIDDLIRALRKTDNILQPAYVKYIRDALDKTFGPATAAAPAAAPAAPAEVPTASSAGTGGGIAPAASTDLKPGDPGTITVPRRAAAEGRRAHGRYIKETRAQKLARQFETYVMSQG
jgi:hypothetical protein